MIDLVGSLRNARKNPHRYFMEYLNLRSRLGESVLICVFEGPEDLPVYDVWIRRHYPERYEPLQVNGKENLLDLNVLLQKSADEKDARILFFADHDFDGSKERTVDDRVYFTPTYSIENLLINPRSFEDTLIYEFGLINAEQPDRKPLIEAFFTKLDDFNEKLLPVNAFIRWLRLEGVECGNLPETTTRLVSVGLEEVRPLFSERLSEVADEFKATAIPLSPTVQEHMKWLRDHNPTKVGRGKFLLDFMKRYLLALYADRRSDKPIYFSRKDRTKPEPCHDVLRKLAGYTSTPDCLKDFIAQQLFTPMPAAIAV